MRTVFCPCHLACAIVLAAAMLASASEVVAIDNSPVVGLSCCLRVSPKRVPGRVTECYEQKPRGDCNLRAFRVITESSEEWCVSPVAKWLKKKIKQGTLQCPPELD